MKDVEKNLCRACGQRFSTVRNFDRHRVGRYEVGAPGYGRRCLSVSEIAKTGLIVRDGEWRQVNPADRLRIAA
jgi:hypothetical protein